jgi:hypothetical protein
MSGAGRPTLYKPEHASRARELCANDLAGRFDMARGTIGQWDSPASEAHPLDETAKRGPESAETPGTRPAHRINAIDRLDGRCGSQFAPPGGVGTGGNPPQCCCLTPGVPVR